MFQKYAELLDLSKDIDWQKPLDPERKIYDKLIGETTVDKPITDEKPEAKKTTKKNITKKSDK
jgi:hypothetical protein